MVVEEDTSLEKKVRIGPVFQVRIRDLVWLVSHASIVITFASVER